MDKSLNDYLKQITQTVENDKNLDLKTRESVLELIAMVSVDPSPDNVEALAIVVEKLGVATQYISAKRTFDSLDATAKSTQAV